MYAPLFRPDLYQAEGEVAVLPRAKVKLGFDVRALVIGDRRVTAPKAAIDRDQARAE